MFNSSAIVIILEKSWIFLFIRFTITITSKFDQKTVLSICWAHRLYHTDIYDSFPSLGALLVSREVSRINACYNFAT